MFVYIWDRLPDKRTHEIACCALQAARLRLALELVTYNGVYYH